MDSSTVTALVSEVSDEKIKSFSVGFEGAPWDELKYARMIAEQYNTEHREFLVRPDIVKILPLLVWHYDEPYSDTSCVPTYYISKAARRHVKVALLGDGGDECFGGYSRYVMSSKRKAYLLADRLRFACRLVPPKYSHAFTKSTQEKYLQTRFIFQDKERQMLLKKRVALNVFSSFKTYISRCRDYDLLNKIMYLDIKTALPGQLTVKVDIASMANSLEVRAPFLDYKFVEFAATIPSRLKVRDKVKKYILKKAMAERLPKEILAKSKMGFGMPVEQWFRKDLKEIPYNLLLDKEAHLLDFMDRGEIKRMLDEHNKGTRNHALRIWPLIWLELWFKTYIDRQRINTPLKGIF